MIIAGAGGAAHLPGMCGKTALARARRAGQFAPLKGLDSLLSIVQMPAGVPVATFAIGKAGATNAALLPRRSWRERTRRWPSASVPFPCEPDAVGARPARSCRVTGAMVLRSGLVLDLEELLPGVAEVRRRVAHRGRSRRGSRST